MPNDSVMYIIVIARGLGFVSCKQTESEGRAEDKGMFTLPLISGNPAHLLTAACKSIVTVTVIKSDTYGSRESKKLVLVFWSPF